MIKFLFREVITEPFKEANLQEKNQSDKPDWQTMTVLVTVAVSLVCIQYFLKYDILGNTKRIGDYIDQLKLSGAINAKERYHIWQLANLAHWVLILFLFYFLLPALVVRFVFKKKLKDFGFRLGNLKKESKIYLYFLLIMLPVVLGVSFTESFQAKYPFLKMLPGTNLYPYFWIWQILYFSQFVFLEFFFRGFMIHGLKGRFGYYAIFVMVIPYVMIHFGKPMAENFAAIIAGVLLGALSMRNKSIIPGIAIHYSVAIAMDLTSLWQKGLL